MIFFSDDMRRDPFPMYRQLRAASPLMHVPPLDVGLVFDHAGVKRVLTDVDAFSSVVVPPTGKAPDWMLFSDPPRHTKLRAIVSRAFTPRSIAGLEPRIRELSRELLAPALARGPGAELDLAVDYAGPLPMIVIAEMLGIPVADRPQFLRWSEAIINLADSIAGDDEAVRAVQVHAVARAEMQPYLAALVAERRVRPADDLLTRLVEAEVDGERLTDDELLGFFQLLIAAGTETTTNLIDNAILCLLEHPDQRARLAAESALLPNAIEEVLRFRSPVQAVFRQTRHEVELHGRTIPAGKIVLPMIGSANRDPAQVADPDRFDITREPIPHISFGHGIHFCLGAALSRLEAKVALPDLLDAGITRVDAAPWHPRKALVVHGPASLPVRLR
jgi:cytochrome P450